MTPHSTLTTPLALAFFAMTKGVGKLTELWVFTLVGSAVITGAIAVLYYLIAHLVRGKKSASQTATPATADGKRTAPPESPRR
jgi:hypothetical protein